VKKILQDNSSLPSELGVLCALAGVNSHVRAFQLLNGKFAQTAKILKDSSAEGVCRFLEAQFSDRQRFS
jgi:hypothetical protein